MSRRRLGRAAVLVMGGLVVLLSLGAGVAAAHLRVRPAPAVALAGAAVSLPGEPRAPAPTAQAQASSIRSHHTVTADIDPALAGSPGGRTAFVLAGTVSMLLIGGLLLVRRQPRPRERR